MAKTYKIRRTRTGKELKSVFNDVEFLEDNKKYTIEYETENFLEYIRHLFKIY